MLKLVLSPQYGGGLGLGEADENQIFEVVQIANNY
jgi:hypothetical protein